MKKKNKARGRKARGRKARGRKTRGYKPKEPASDLSTFIVSPEDRDGFRAAIRETAANSVAEFPKALELVREQFRQCSPLAIMASFANYTLLRIGDIKDPHQGTTLNNIQQYDAELLQAVLLSVPPEEWGKNPLTPGIMQIVFDIVPKLSETFFHQRVLAAPQTTDEQEEVVQFLQERIRFHTQAVRNWGYFTDVVKITTELYKPLDRPFSAHYGFGIGDIVHVMKSVVTEYERRASEHFSILQKVSRGKNIQQLVKLYYENMPDLVGEPEELIATLPPGVTKEGVFGFLMSHLDLRLFERSIFKTDEVAAQTGYTPEVVEKLLSAFSLQPGSLVDTQPEYLFLSNPIWTAPGIDLGGSFFIPMPQVVFSHIHPAIIRLCEAAGLKKGMENTRARFLETKLDEVLTTALPSATIRANPKWRSGNQQFETDYLAIVDRIAVIVEAKSNQLTPPGMRGAPDRVKKHIEEIVLEPSIQSNRLKRLIVDAQNGDKMAGETVRGLGIDPSKIDRIIRLSVTLEDLSIMRSSEDEFKKIGWIPADHDLAPTISITDLIYLVDILDDPILILHYLYERMFLQKTFNIIGDEMDFLGLYLAKGFNLADPEEQHGLFLVTGCSEQIDRYYNSRDVGIRLPKPKVELSPLFRGIIDRLSERRKEGWTIVGLHLLNSADYTEQHKVEKALSKLRRVVRRKYREPTHVNSLHIQPQQSRKAQLVFYLYPDKLRSARKTVMEQLASEALEQSQSEECCVFGKCIDNWSVPYETIFIASK